MTTVDQAPVAAAPEAPAATGPARRSAVALIRLYQGLRGPRPSPCRYFPTCSTYAAEAIERHGLWYGGRLALRRLARCRPGGSHGVDLVPLERRARGSVTPAPAPHGHEWVADTEGAPCI